MVDEAVSPYDFWEEAGEDDCDDCGEYLDLRECPYCGDCLCDTCGETHASVCKGD